MKIKTDKELYGRSVQVVVAGCGGTGSQVVAGLYRIHRGLLAAGHEYGLSVMVCDPDVVTVANVGRQLFYASDIGKHKCAVLVNRYNYAYGVDWNWTPEGAQYLSSDIVIGCVDSRRSRRTTYPEGKQTMKYAIDCGNGSDYGQVLIGTQKKGIREIAPELFEGEDKTEDGPSCSLAEAIRKQDLFVNDFAARIALNAVWGLLRHGGLDYNAVYYNLASMRMQKTIIE